MRVDYAAREITLDRPVTWADGQGVSLIYAGNAPDVGAVEHGLTGDGAVGPAVR